MRVIGEVAEETLTLIKVGCYFVKFYSDDPIVNNS